MFPQPTPAVKSILIITIAIFFIGYVPGIGDILDKVAILYPVTSENFNPFQFFTYMFMHAGGRHLIGNMLIIFFFGPMVEAVWGSQRFLVFYLACGLGASLIYGGVKYYEHYDMERDYAMLVQHPTPVGMWNFIRDHGDGTRQWVLEKIEDYESNPQDTYLENESLRVLGRLKNEINQYQGGLLGASGAVFGVLMALGLMFPENTIHLLIPPIPIKIKYFVFILGAMEYFAFIRAAPGDNVAHNVHLAGMLVAFLLIKFGSFKGRYNR